MYANNGYYLFCIEIHSPADAKKRKWEPGLAWQYKVDGRIEKSARLRKTGAEGDRLNEVRRVVVEDTGFADDTAILGREEEAQLSKLLEFMAHNIGIRRINYLELGNTY